MCTSWLGTQRLTYWYGSVCYLLCFDVISARFILFTSVWWDLQNLRTFYYMQIWLSLRRFTTWLLKVVPFFVFFLAVEQRQGVRTFHQNGRSLGTTWTLDFGQLRSSFVQKLLGSVCYTRNFVKSVDLV